MICRTQTIVPIGNPLKYSFYKKSKVLHYNELNNTGFVTEKSYKKTVEILFDNLFLYKNLSQLSNLIKRHYNEILKYF